MEVKPSKIVNNECCDEARGHDTWMDLEKES